MRTTFLIFFTLTILGCSPGQPLPKPIVIVPIATRSEIERVVAEAAREDRAIIFVHVGWAPMEPQKRLFLNFSNHWNRTNAKLPIAFYYLDFSIASRDYSPITNLPGWSETHERLGRNPFHGNGEWAWILEGELVDIGPVWQASLADLDSRTSSAFRLQADRSAED